MGGSGVRMPLGGPFLKATDANIIRNWINNGAPGPQADSADAKRGMIFPFAALRLVLS